MAINLDKVKRYSLSSRKSKIKISSLASLGRKNSSFKGFYDILPDVLAAKNFKYVVNAIIAARNKKKPVIFMLGAHVIKCGLSPLIIDLLKRKIINCIALNGAGIIHDFELAFSGKTSEDVAEALNSGKFGMSRETADFLNQAIAQGDIEDLGIGEAVGKKIAESNLPLRRHSILYRCFKLKIPVTVHVSLGADIIHQHPSTDGAAIGEASLRDFRKLTEVIASLGNGGVAVNIGSAVVLPEVFLKALNLARNLGSGVCNFTTANFDMLHQYRSYQNVVHRPPLGAKSKGVYILGHHEIMIPLLYQAILEKL